MYQPSSSAMTSVTLPRRIERSLGRGRGGLCTSIREGRDEDSRAVIKDRKGRRREEPSRTPRAVTISPMAAVLWGRSRLPRAQTSCPSAHQAQKGGHSIGCNFHPGLR